ncbi:MAG TPA: hypothetical protein VMX76_00970 [Nevskiaceae bacterium]|nr:hypothetical protein [Nevskiaceae bacterium]
MQPTVASPPKSKHWLILVLLALIVVITGAFGFFIYQNYHSKYKTDIPATSQQVKTQNNSLENTVAAFFQAVQAEDKKTVKNLLSENVNNVPSLYTQDFSFAIKESKISSSSKKAYVYVDLNVSEQIIENVLVLIKNDSGHWLIIDSQSVVLSEDVPPFARQESQSSDLKRVLLTLVGPADFYLTSPEGTHTGFNAEAQKQVSEIADVGYNGPEAIIETLSITGLLGVWELNIIGNGNGEYQLGTELIDNKNHQTQIIKNNTTKGAIDSFILEYPYETGKPLQVTEVK